MNGLVHNDSQEAKVMLGTKLCRPQWKKTIYTANQRHASRGMDIQYDEHIWIILSKVEVCIPLFSSLVLSSLLIKSLPSFFLSF